MTGRHGRARGVSSVVGVVLVVAITVVVATVVGATALGVAGQLPDETPTNVAYDAEYVRDGAGNGGRPFVEVTVTAGRVSLGGGAYVVDESGTRVDWGDVWSGGDYLESGETFRIDGVDTAGVSGADDDALETPCDGETYRVVRPGDGGQRAEVVMRVTAGVAAPGAAGC